MNHEPRTQNLSDGFYKRLKDERRRKGLTQQQLAERIGVQQAVVGAWERAGLPKQQKRRFPNLIHLTELCQGLGVSADKLLGLRESVHGGKADLRWIETMPPPETLYYDDALVKGVKLFAEIAKGEKTAGEIESTYRNTATLRHLLRAIFVRGTIRIVDVKTDPVREEQVQNEFPAVKKCIVAKLDKIPIHRAIDASIRNEAVSFLAAQDADQSLHQVSSCGIVGGAVISRWVDLLPSRFERVRWISMVKTAGIEAPSGNTANALVGRLAYTQGSPIALQMPFVDINRRQSSYRAEAKGYERIELLNAIDVLGYARDVEVVFMSVGCKDNYRTGSQHPLTGVLREMTVEHQNRVVGDILLRLIDENGEPVGTKEDQVRNDAIVHSINLEELRAIAKRGDVWILAGQSSKAACIRAALEAELANSLVIDSSVADALLH
ncbi:MAG: helix-turn-helix domain-containing protein [Anaerolineae bacterium]|nr:helix-turn-helix domain-containing protein [Anaerolineae bacterium]